METAGFILNERVFSSSHLGNKVFEDPEMLFFKSVFNNNFDINNDKNSRRESRDSSISLYYFACVFGCVLK